MKPARVILCLVLLWGFLLSLCSCGTTSSTALSTVPLQFSAQSSVHCTIQYTADFDAVIDGTEYPELEHNCVAEAQVDLTTGDCWILGEMTAQTGDTSGESSEIESYGDSAGSYYRYGNLYGSTQEPNLFLTLVQLPMSLNLDQDYTRQSATELLYGAPCTVYSGTEISDDRPQGLLFGPGLETGFSLDGCIVDVSLLVYDDTGLPASVRLDYSNLEEMNLTFSDQQGNSFTLTSLRYQVLYENYGTQVTTSVPEEFRQAASEGTLNLTDLFGQLTEASTPSTSESDEASESLPAQAQETEGTYTISNAAGTYAYQITAPEYMALEEQDDNFLSFYYYYSETDLERISYTLYEDFTQEDEEAYAQSLPEFYRQTEGISEVQSDGLHSITIGDYQVWYSTVYLTLEQDGQSYEVIDLYSWVVTPNGQDSLEVCITEYNGSDDGTMIDPEQELEYAYGAILGYNEMQ